MTITAQNLAAALRAAANALDGGGAQTVTTPAPVAAAPVAQPVPAAAPVAPVPAEVNGDVIMALIQPHVGNEAIKAALGTAMRALGINALPETQAHQYVPLYQAFQAVIAQHTAQPVAAAPVSII